MQRPLFFLFVLGMCGILSFFLIGLGAGIGTGWAVKGSHLDCPSSNGTTVAVASPNDPPVPSPSSPSMPPPSFPSHNTTIITLVPMESSPVPPPIPSPAAAPPSPPSPSSPLSPSPPPSSVYVYGRRLKETKREFSENLRTCAQTCTSRKLECSSDTVDIETWEQQYISLGCSTSIFGSVKYFYINSAGECFHPDDYVGDCSTVAQKSHKVYCPCVASQ